MPDRHHVSFSYSRAAGGRRKRCQKGKNCSAACIERNDVCLVEIPVSASNEVKRLRDSLERKGDTVPKKPPITKEVRDKFKADTLNREILKIVGRALDNNSWTSQVAIDEYNRKREEIKEFNRELVRQGLAKKLGLIKVPVSVDKLKKAKESFYKAKASLATDASRALSNGDIGAFDKVARRYKSLFDKLGLRLRVNSVDDSSGVVQIFKSEALKIAHSRVFKEINEAAKTGKRGTYNKLERFIREVEKRIQGAPRTEIGQVWKLYEDERMKRKIDGIQKLESYTKTRLRNAALDNNRDLYDKLEKRLMRMQSKVNEKFGRELLFPVAKGQVWNNEMSKRYKKKLDPILYKLRQGMKKAIEKNDRRAYDRYEGRFIKLEKHYNDKFNTGLKTQTKGAYWDLEREAIQTKKAGNLKNLLRKKLTEAAKKKDRKTYDRLERRYLAVEKAFAGKIGDGVLKVTQKGEIWKQERRNQYNKVKDKIVLDMQNAAKNDKKALYDKLEQRLLKLQDRLGGYTGEHRYGKGEVWENQKVASQSAKYLAKLDRLIDSDDFTATISKTDGYYSNFIRAINDASARILGLGKPSVDDNLYEERKQSLVSRLGKGVVERGILAIKDFTDNQYGDIRTSQKANDKNSPEYKKGVLIEKIINARELDRPEVVKFRGITVNDEKLDRLRSLVGSATFHSEGATSSWSTSLETAADFSKNGLRIWGDHQVIFRTINKRGIPVEEFTESTDEYEIVTSRKAKYRHLDYRKIENGGRTYHVFDLEEQ